MTPYISFAWTTPALLAGRKTVTRRDWNPSYARRFTAGTEVTAYDRLPRNGGTPIARLRLTHDATHEPDADAPDGDWEAEGFGWFWEREVERAFADGFDHPHGEIAERVEYEGFEEWRAAGGSSWVIRFEVIEYLQGPLANGAAA